LQIATGPDQVEAVGVYTGPFGTGAVGPSDPDVRFAGIPQPEMDPTKLVTGVPAANQKFLGDCVLPDGHLDSGTDGVRVGSIPGEPQRQPVATGTGIPPNLNVLDPVDNNEIKQPVEVQVDKGRSPAPRRAGHTGISRSLLERPIRLTD
jgi:hypothetical protein